MTCSISKKFIGHSKIQETFDVYGRLLPGGREEVRERMDSYLAGLSMRARPDNRVPVRITPGGSTKDAHGDRKWLKPTFRIRS